jgi:hypothetical protein
MEKPTPEAKALSLYLMAHKSISASHKDKARRMNKLWDQDKTGELAKEDYAEEVNNVLEAYGGYKKVIEQTVKFYIQKTGKWSLEGEDKYCLDAKEIADKVMEK